MEMFQHYSPNRVPGSNRAKTCDSRLSLIFQALTSDVIRNFPKNDAWLTRGNVVQIIDVLVATSINFPEKTYYRESPSRTVGLTIGFRTTAAANPFSEPA
jgi:hypothetical protein